MGIWERLFGTKKQNESTGIDISSLESDLGRKINEDIKHGKSVEEIESNAEAIIDSFTNDLKESLVAKLADDWTCSVCETKNHKTPKCDKCGYEAGCWKCPKCGNVVTGNDEYGPLEIACDCGFDYGD